jgi:outer membrane protein assembly factor BamB
LNRHFSVIGLVVLSVGVLWGNEPAPRDGVDWPSFRGIRASGVSDGFGAPTEWSVETGRNILWKVPIAGLGNSSPVIWGNHLCLTTATGGKGMDARPPTKEPGSKPTSITDDAELEWQVICLDKRSGSVVWTQTANRGKPSTGRHSWSSHANPTLATDGKHLVAFFGSQGIYGYRLADGKPLWKRDLGLLDSGWFVVPSWQWGYASSPIIHDGRVVVQCDVIGQQFLAAFSVKNGKELWRTKRSDVPTFGTPTVVTVKGRDQIVTNGWREIAGYEFAMGKRLWSIDATKGGGDIPVPTPVAGHGLVFITNSHAGSPIFAIRPDVRGDLVLTDDKPPNGHVAWTFPRDGAYMPTPLVYGKYYYHVKDTGVLSVFEPLTGERVHQARIAKGTGGVTASLVAADGHIYITDADGNVFVVKAAAPFEVVAQNSIDGRVLSTPAISEGRLYFRTRSDLIAVGFRDPAPTGNTQLPH